MDDLYGRHGVVDRSVMWEDPSPRVPDLAWLEEILCFVGIPARAAVPLTFAAYVGGLLALLVGYRTRLAAALTCLFHMALCSSSYMACYGIDAFAQIGLFYCIWFPVGQALSLERFPGRAKGEATFDARLGLRVLQMHVCIAYMASGVEKALGEQWWNGEAIWRALMSAPLDGSIDCSFLATFPWLARIACWTTLLLEAGAVAFVWHPSLRKSWLVGIVGMHLGIALFLNLWTFSATMIVFDIAAFGCRGDERLAPGSVRQPGWKDPRGRRAEKGQAVAVAAV
jgi:hypothetical protein